MKMEEVAVPTPEQIAARAAARAFGSRLVQNNLRSLVVEEMVEAALAPGWQLCSGDWQGWDLQHGDGSRLEVKQSTMLQTWMPSEDPAPRFDIAPRTGYWIGNTWHALPGRPAHIYLFAYHPITDETADHRDCRQWLFYVVRAELLPPDQKTIGLAVVRTFSHALSWSELRLGVDEARAKLGRRIDPLPVLTLPQSSQLQLSLAFVEPAAA
jgi:hypothetical protein